jgi:hypothetical protein
VVEESINARVEMGTLITCFFTHEMYVLFVQYKYGAILSQYNDRHFPLHQIQFKEKKGFFQTCRALPGRRRKCIKFTLFIISTLVLISLNRSWILNKISLLFSSVADPDSGSGAFLTLRSGYGSGISFSGSRIPYLGSPTRIFEILAIICWVKNT